MWVPIKSRALQAQMLEVLFVIRAYKPVLSIQGVRSIIHPLCGCATNVIQKNHLRIIMWLLKLHCNERKVTFMENKTNSLSHTKWMCKYHIVFSPKYRRKIIYNQYRKSPQEIDMYHLYWVFSKDGTYHKAVYSFI